jgi:hypothetical protein
MNCYICETAPGAGGTRLGTWSAIGVCTSCGIGLCFRHAHRSTRTGGLFCDDCRRRAEDDAAKASQESVAATARRP